MIWYGNAMKAALNKEVDFDTDIMVVTLHTATYVPSRTVHDYVNDLTNELATGAGYTAGGVTTGTKTITYTVANSWGTVAAVSTAYGAGDVVRPVTGNTYLYRAIAAGTSGATAPTWPTTVGQTVVDGGVTWVNVGTGITVIDFADPTWAAPATFTGVRYAVLSDRTPATAATQPLIAFSDFITDQAGAGGDFRVVLHAQGALHLFSP